MKDISVRRPEYEVLIHIKVNEFSKHLEKEIHLLTLTPMPGLGTTKDENGVVAIIR